MKVVSFGRDAGRQALHADADVQQIVSSIASFPLPEMITLLADTLYKSGMPLTPMAVRFLVGARRLPNPAIEDASKLAVSALTIANKSAGPRTAFRGAVLEAVTELMLQQRSTPKPEAVLDGLCDPPWSGGLSNPMDFCVEASAMEVYECKSGLKHLDTGDIDLLDEIHDHHECIHAIATLHPRVDLANRLSELTVRFPIFSAAKEDLIPLSAGPPTFQVAP